MQLGQRLRARQDGWHAPMLAQLIRRATIGTMEPSSEQLTRAWNDAQARLPAGWTLDSLRCASTGLGTDQRSADWIAVAVGPGAEQREHRAADPLAALSGLAIAAGS